MNKKIWFKRKLYGWGWYPSTWEGWLVIVVWAVFFTFAMISLDHEAFKNALFIFLSTMMLIVVCYKKGEKPRWQWGKRIDD
jgi:hypothetical protein